MASFFNKIDAPDLTQSAQSIETMVQAINDNFQKVFTLPFLKGDPGDEITTRFEYFWDDNKLLTQEAADIFNTVFDLKNIFTVGLSFDKFILVLITYNIINKDNIDIEQTYWEDNYGPTKEPKILLYYKINAEDTTEEKIGVAQLYYFFDPRITLLSKNLLLYNNGFKDYTCILTTEYNIDENGNYSYEYIKQTGWPTLYYNLSTSQFCWAINGHQTGINAQGVNGKDGIGSKVWLVKLNNTSLGSGKIFDSDEKYLENYYTRFSIESVWYPASKKWIAKNEMETTLQKNSGQIFTYDDVFIGYVTGSDPLMEIGLWKFNDNKELVNTNEYIKDIPVPDMWIGTLHYDETAKENEDKYFVMCNISQNLSVANNNMNLCKMLADIKPSTTNDDPNHLKGLYLRSDTNNNNIHAIFNGGHIKPDNTDLYIAPTTLEYMSNSDTIKTISNKNLNIVYNTNIYGDFNIRDLLNFKYTEGEFFSILNIIPSIYENSDPQVNLGTTSNRIGDIYVSNIYSNNIISNIISTTIIKIDEISSNDDITLSSKNILPNNSNTISLGSENKRFNNIYTKNFNASESLTIKKVDYNNGEVSKHYGQTFIKGGNFYINSTGDIKENPDSNYVGLSYKDNDLIFYGNYDDKWGGNSSIPIIKSTRYDDSGTSSIENMIRFRNNGTLIYDKLFVGNDNNSIIEKNTLPTDYTLYVNGQTYINAELTIYGATTLKNTLSVSGATTLNDTLTVGTTNSNKDTTLNGKLVVADTTQLNNAVTLNWNKSNYYSNDTTTSDLLAKSLLNIGGEGLLRVIFSRNSIQSLSNNKDDDKHYKTNTLYINPLGGGVNIGGTTTLNSDLILNSKNLGGNYYSNKIIFLRNVLNDDWNDWYMYGNNSGLLEIDCSRSGLSDGKIMTLSCDNSGNKSVNVVGKITGKVNNIEEVNIGMPVGSIILWLNPHNIPDGYILFNANYENIKNNSINKLFNKYDGGNIKNKMTSTYVGKTDMGVTFNNEISINITDTTATIKYNTKNIVDFDLDKIPIICSSYTYTFTNNNKMEETCLSLKGYYLTDNSTLYDTTNNYDNEKQKFLFIELILKLLGNQIDNKTLFVVHLMVNDSKIYHNTIHLEKLYILYDFKKNTNTTEDGDVYLNCKNKLLYDYNNDDGNNLLEIYTDKNNHPIGINFNKLYIRQTNSDTYDILKYK